MKQGHDQVKVQKLAQEQALGRVSVWCLEQVNSAAVIAASSSESVAESCNPTVCKSADVTDSKESEIKCMLESEDSLLTGVSKNENSNNVLVKLSIIIGVIRRTINNMPMSSSIIR